MPKAAQKKKTVTKKVVKKVAKKTVQSRPAQSESMWHMTVPQEVLAVFVLACMLYFAYVMMHLLA